MIYFYSTLYSAGIAAAIYYGYKYGSQLKDKFTAKLDKVG